MACKGLCDRVTTNIRYYKGDVKRCSVCCVYIDTPDLFCPCCNSRLRTRPRDGRLRERFRRYVA
jgi:hypothetical protein